MRNKLLFVGIGLIAVLLVLSLAVVSVSLAKERQAHREAETGKQNARSEAAKSQQVTRFLEDMLQGVGPSVALGRDTAILRDILDKAATRISMELTNQPAVEAELRTRIGNVYGELALFDKAEAAFREALNVRRHLFGSENTDVATSLNDLSRVLLLEEKVAEAETFNRESLATRKKLLGEENLEVADSLDSLEIILREQGKRAEAETMARKVLAMRRKILGDEHPLVAESLINLTPTLTTLEEVESCYQEALAIQSKLVGEDHLNVAVGLSNLAFLLRARHSFVEAEKMLRHALSVEGRFLPKEHPEYISTERKLGLTLESEGKLAEAEETDREVLNLARKVYPQGDYLVAAALRSFDDVLMSEKKYGEVEQLLAEMLAPDFVAKPESARCLVARADYLARRSRWKDAAADVALALKYRPTNYHYFHMLAPLLAVSGNQGEYEQTCQRILKEFRETTEPYIADPMAKDCLLLPWTGADGQGVSRMAETAVSDPTAPAIHYFEGCKALSDYRRGNFKSAVDLAQKSLVAPPADLEAMACAVLAMANYRLKDTDGALGALARGANVVQDKLPRRGSDDLGPAWQGWIFAQVLMDEAGGLIQPSFRPEPLPSTRQGQW